MTGNVNNLMGLGLPEELGAQMGLSPIAAVTSAGSSATDATILKKGQTFVNGTFTGADGIKLPADADIGVEYLIFNGSGSTGLIYPPTSGTLNLGTATTGTLSMTTHKVARFIRYSSTGWVYSLTA